ncbi:unnamed protein product, partial [Mesorhabditis spiculigera]
MASSASPVVPPMREPVTQVLGHFLGPHDVVVESPTGSGKTLAFGLPVLTMMRRHSDKTKSQWKPSEIGALILSPTRELAIQTGKVLEPFAAKLEFKLKTAIGGSKKPVDELAAILKDGCNLLVATPGRLEQLLTLDTTQALHRALKALLVLIIDEADRFTEAAFSQSITQIMAAVPKQRRTGLFSATQAKEAEDLIKFPLHEPITIKLKEQEDTVCPTTLTNYYITSDAHLKMITLLEFIRSKPNEKIVVFLSSRHCVDYLVLIFPRLLKKRAIFGVHGQNTEKRTVTLEKFRNSTNGVLLCTDVFSRGIDVPNIDWVVQFDVPRTSSWFVHRAGRAGRCGREGFSLLMLTPQETAFIQFVEKYEQVKLEETHVKTVTELKAEQLMEQMRKFAVHDRAVLNAGTRAFVSFIEAYKRHDCHIVCPLKDQDLVGLAHAYGLLRMPRMEELSARTDLDKFKRSDVDTSKIKFLDEKREKMRLEKMGDKAVQKQERKKAAIEKKEKKAKKRKPTATRSNATPNKKTKFADNDVDDRQMMRKMKGGRLGKKDLKAID